MYPTGLSSKNGTLVGWRAVYEVFPSFNDLGAFSANCATWGSVDFLVYGGVGVDEFLFGMNVGGTEAVSIEPRVLLSSMGKEAAKGRAKMVKKSKGIGWKA